MGNKSHVNVFARNEVNGKIDWSMTSSEKKSNGNLRFYRKDHEDSWVVEFTLHDKTGRDLVFPDNLNDALWVKKANDPKDCCEQASTYPALTPTGLDSTKTVLTCANTNKVKEDLAFTLRAIPRGKDQSKPTNYVEYDPIVENKNGSDDFTYYSYVLVGAAIGAAAGYFASQSFEESAAAAYAIAGAVVGAVLGFLFSRMG